MTPIGLGLDILLIILLLVALTVGLRLNRRLKALREGQAGFVAAVSELDTAAARAEAGLTALRAASEAAHDTLLSRIEAARALTARLEAATVETERLRGLGELAPAAAPMPVRAEGRPDPRLRDGERPARRAPSLVRGLDDDLFESQPPGAPRRMVGR